MCKLSGRCCMHCARAITWPSRSWSSGWIALPSHRTNLSIRRMRSWSTAPPGTRPHTRSHAHASTRAFLPRASRKCARAPQRGARVFAASGIRTSDRHLCAHTRKLYHHASVGRQPYRCLRHVDTPATGRAQSELVHMVCTKQPHARGAARRGCPCPARASAGGGAAASRRSCVCRGMRLRTVCPPTQASPGLVVQMAASAALVRQRRDVRSCDKERSHPEVHVGGDWSICMHLRAEATRTHARKSPALNRVRSFVILAPCMCISQHPPCEHA